MGIRANVLFEEAGNWDTWRSATLADALFEAKRRLLLRTVEHDAFLLDLLARRLSLENGELVWPRDVRSALVFWHSGER
jgi:predicted ABC-type transport system involved in lysophospholipase L1 biosynthesis ATPase subunit